MVEALGHLRAKWQLIALMAAVMVAYGVSFFINTIAGSFVKTPSVWALLLLNAAGRAMTLWVVIPLLWWLRWRPPTGSIAINRHLLTAATAPVCGHAGFVCYFGLVTGAEVSLLVPMIGLYSLVPTAWGLIRRGDSRHCTKLSGIAASVAALLLLGFSGSGAALGGGPGLTASDMVVKLLLFAATFLFWGAGDVISSGVHLDPLSTAVASLLGQTTCAAAFGFAAAVASETPSAERPAPGPGFGWPHMVMMSANGLAVLGWLAFVRAGQLGETSFFVPITSLYTFIPVMLSFAFLGEPMGALKLVGLIVAAAAIVLIGWPHPHAAPSHVELDTPASSPSSDVGGAIGVPLSTSSENARARGHADAGADASGTEQHGDEVGDGAIARATSLHIRSGPSKGRAGTEGSAAAATPRTPALPRVPSLGGLHGAHGVPSSPIMLGATPGPTGAISRTVSGVSVGVNAGGARRVPTADPDRDV